MSQPPRPFGAIPMREPGAPLRALSPPPALEPPLPLGDAEPIQYRGSRRLSTGLAWRAFRRHWFLALAAWVIGTGAIVALVDCRVRPTFEAASDIRVEPGDRDQFRDGGPGGDFEVFKETQARRVANPKVIAKALAADPGLLDLPILAGPAIPRRRSARR